MDIESNQLFGSIRACCCLIHRLPDLHHESVSQLVEGGLSEQQVAVISGHKSMHMLRRCTHLKAEDLVEELDAIAKGKKA